MKKPRNTTPPNRTDAIRAHYEPRISIRRPHHEILDWASAQSQQARFQALVDHVALNGLSLLDVGSGMGDLLTFLEARGLHVAYTGVDLVEKMVQAARIQRPDARFVHADIFARNPFGRKSYDVVFCSGALNLNLGNNRDFLPRAVGTFLEIASRHVVFNLLHFRARSGEERYAYHNPQEVLDMLQPMKCAVTLVDDYLHNDFTVICTL